MYYESEGINDLAEWFSGGRDSSGGKLLVGRRGPGYASERPPARMRGARGALYAEGNDNEANGIADGGVAGGRGGF
jgi:hypothetical protein